MSSYKIINPTSIEPYLPLIFSSWLRSLRYGNDLFRLIDAKAYYPAYHRFIEAILSRPDTDIRVAVLTEDHDVALGFSVSRGTILDYVFVQKDQRKLGIANRLIPEGITTFTHITKPWMKIWEGKRSVWVFNPFI